MTYMDVRFLVDDMNLQLKDAAPKVDASDVSKGAPTAPRGRREEGLPGQGEGEARLERRTTDEERGPRARRPPGPGQRGQGQPQSGALASGTVTFSDGVTGKWVVDHQGRPGLVDVSKPGLPAHAGRRPGLHAGARGGPAAPVSRGPRAGVQAPFEHREGRGSTGESARPARQGTRIVGSAPGALRIRGRC